MIKYTNLMSIRNLIPHNIVNTFYHLPKAFLAVLYYRYPAKDLTVIGITGTDGKTTTSTVIYEILRQAGKKTALITSVSAKIGGKELSTGLHVTSPDPWELQKLLRYISDKGFNYVVLESTSHGLAQHRLLGCNFKIGAVTNITHEHLDYHGTWKKYLKDKARLFKKAKFAVLNKDDLSFKILKKNITSKIITYGMKKADFTLKNFPFKTKMPGKYNQYNCLAAIAVTKLLNISDADIRKAIAKFKGVMGRMDVVYDKSFKVIIDFAHTPNALKQVLIACKEMPSKRLISVFGCAGLRDSRKRLLMGEISCRLADVSIFTAEDPRTENINDIFRQMESGCKNKKNLYKEPDRKKAIKLAISMAKKGDIIGIFGKGHEKSMCYGTVEYPWSDHKAVKEILKKHPSS